MGRGDRLSQRRRDAKRMMVRWKFVGLLAFGLIASGAESKWIRLKSANFELYSSAGLRNARETLKEFEQVRGFFLQVFGGPPAKPVPVRLVVFGSAKEYEPYRYNEFSTAYYQPTADHDYIVMSHGGVDTFPIAVHEYVHLLVRHSELDLPPWLNEGLAELYSTLRPIGDKILVGDLIRGRYLALQREKWVPLAVILGAGRDSPYYNEKDKAGSLYNEGWALTHMLYFREEYRPKFGQFMKTVSGGTDSVQALMQVYGRSVAQVETDLQAYLRGTSFQGALVTAKLEKASGEMPAEPLGEFDSGVVLTELLERPRNEAAAHAAWERLAQEEPKRPDPYRGLGYLAWRDGKASEALTQFGKAFERGEREPKFLWDYGRLLERWRGEDAINVFRELLSLDDARVEVRMELSETQLRANHPVAALATLAPIQKVTSENSARFFRIAVYAQLQAGNLKDAAETAKHFRQIARTDADRAEADRLVAQTTVRDAVVQRSPGQIEQMPHHDQPALRRRESAVEQAPTPAPKRPTMTGKFVQLDCRGSQARMIVETDAGRKTFLIEDPAKVAITAGSDGPVDMTCGAQKATPKVEIGYDTPRTGQTGIDGIVRTLAF